MQNRGKKPIEEKLNILTSYQTLDSTHGTVLCWNIFLFGVLVNAWDCYPWYMDFWEKVSIFNNLSLSNIVLLIFHMGGWLKKADYV